MVVNTRACSSAWLRGVVVGTAGLVLGGCAARDVVLAEAPPGYVEDAPERAAEVDFSRAQEIEVRLDEFAFKPAKLVFRRGTPYRLHIENVGGVPHTFVSEGFFKAIAVKALTGREGEAPAVFVETIAVAPGDERELTFVPLRSGTFELECTVPGHATFGMVGEITVTSSRE